MNGYYDLQRKFPFLHSHPPNVVAPFGVGSLVLHFGFLFGFFPATADNNILPDWSIGLEMQFYFVFPFMMLILRGIGPFWFALGSLAIVVLSQSVATTFPQPSFLPLVVTAFVVGIFMSEAWVARDRARSAVLLVLAIFMSSIRLPFMFQVIPLAMMILINFRDLFADLRMNRLGAMVQNLLSGRLGMFLGDRSYSIYLIHMLVIVPLVSSLASNGWFASGPPGLRFAIVALAMIAICYGLASITLYFIENPGIELGRRIVRRWRSPAPDKTVTVD